jgi:hypothetical protein
LLRERGWPRQRDLEIHRRRRHVDASHHRPPRRSVGSHRH